MSGGPCRCGQTFRAQEEGPKAAFYRPITARSPAAGGNWSKKEPAMQVFFTIGRIFLVAIFILSGAQKLLDVGATAQLIQTKIPTDMLTDLAAPLVEMTGMRVPQLLAILVGVIELVSGVLIAFNVGTRGAALLLVLFTIAATYFYHDFWTMTGPDREQNMIHALKNLSIIGGLLVLFALGSRRVLVPARID
jgi:putative oxidoreductase